MNNDRPDTIPLARHECVLACAFICPRQSDQPIERGKTYCNYFQTPLETTKATISGTIGERHPVTVGVRATECVKNPPRFVIVLEEIREKSKPKKRMKDVVDQP